MYGASVCWRLRQEDYKFEPSLDHMVRPCLRKGFEVGKEEEERIQKNMVNIVNMVNNATRGLGSQNKVRGSEGVQEQISNTSLIRKTLEGRRQGKVDNLSNVSDCGVAREESTAQLADGKECRAESLKQKAYLRVA